MLIPERAARETGRDYALRTIRENIVSLELAPGVMLSENELAAMLGLSRTPVREALIELSKVKIVEIYPQRGSAVALIDCDMVEQACFMRNVMECAVVEQVCALAGSEKLAALEANLRLQEFRLHNHEPAALLALDNEFHFTLFALADKPQIYAMMDSLTIHFDRIRSLSLTTVRDLKIVEDHRAILAAIRAGDAPAAHERMARHLSRYKVDETEIRRQYPAYFK